MKPIVIMLLSSFMYSISIFGQNDTAYVKYIEAYVFYEFESVIDESYCLKHIFLLEPSLPNDTIYLYDERGYNSNFLKYFPDDSNFVGDRQYYTGMINDEFPCSSMFNFELIKRNFLGSSPISIYSSTEFYTHTTNNKLYLAVSVEGLFNIYHTSNYEILKKFTFTELAEGLAKSNFNCSGIYNSDVLSPICIVNCIYELKPILPETISTYGLVRSNIQNIYVLATD